MEKDKAYISKEEKKIPINDPTGKWSDPYWTDFSLQETYP